MTNHCHIFTAQAGYIVMFFSDLCSVVHSTSVIFVQTVVLKINELTTPYTWGFQNTWIFQLLPLKA